MRNTNVLIGTIGGIGLIAGCVSIHPELDQRSGEAIVYDKNAQTLNPQGRGIRMLSPESMAGRRKKRWTAMSIHSSRRRRTTNVINIGGSLAWSSEQQ